MVALVVLLCSCGSDNSAELERQKAEIERLKQDATQKETDLKQREQVLAAQASKEKAEKELQLLKEQMAKKAVEKSAEPVVTQVKETAEKLALETAEKQKKEFLDNSVACSVCRGSHTVKTRKMVPCEKCTSLGVIDSSSSSTTVSSNGGSTTTTHIHNSSSHPHSRILCAACDGVGSVQSATSGDCPCCTNGRILKTDLAAIVRCKKCFGAGTVDGKKMIICITCAGRGEKEGMLKNRSSATYHHSAPTYREMVPCTFCAGSGALSKPCKISCDECLGLGVARI